MPEYIPLDESPSSIIRLHLLPGGRAILEELTVAHRMILDEAGVQRLREALNPFHDLGAPANDGCAIPGCRLPGSLPHTHLDRRVPPPLVHGELPFGGTWCGASEPSVCMTDDNTAITCGACHETLRVPAPSPGLTEESHEPPEYAAVCCPHPVGSHTAGPCVGYNRPCTSPGCPCTDLVLRWEVMQDDTPGLADEADDELTDMVQEYERLNGQQPGEGT